jgi:hypothetical protein
MILRLPPFCIAGVLLAGCAPQPEPTAGPAPGYLYHDANHPGGLSLSVASPQADYNATHGMWLWPPAAGGKPN